MTRETKIGLLVGLAFIIVLGILLSNQISTTNEPLSAQLSDAGANLRSGLGQSNDDVAPVLRAPQAITPKEPVVINQELKHHTAQPPVRFVDPPAVVTRTPTPDTAVPQNLRAVAQQHGEELVPANDNSNPAPADPNPPVVMVKPQPTKTGVARSYEVQPGDSLGSIARKMYGSGSRANCEAIVAANPSLADNRDLVVAGRTYTIPALDAAPATPTQETSTKQTAAKASIYVVKQHDTLYTIAMLEVGTPSAISAIKELNKDVLNGSDRLRPNMKLKLPGKVTE